ncbi:hypothetical protein RCL1_008831 [Eukaryota sp. TZLM3-RCL]
MSRKRSSTILPHPEDQAGESSGEPERFLDAPPEVVSKRKMFVPKSGGSLKPAPPPEPSPTPSTKAPMTLESNGQTFVPPLGQATKMFDVNVIMFSEFVLLSEKQQQEEEKSKKDQQKPVKQQEPTPLPTLKPSSQPHVSEQETHSEAEKSLDEDGGSEEEDASSQNNPFTTNPFGFASKSPSSSQTAPAFGFSSSSTNPFSFPSLPSEGSNPFLMATSTSNPFTSSSTFPPTPATSSPFASNPFAASQQSTQESSQRDSDEDTEEEEDVKPDIHLMQTGEVLIQKATLGVTSTTLKRSPRNPNTDYTENRQLFADKSQSENFQYKDIVLEVDSDNAKVCGAPTDISKYCSNPSELAENTLTIIETFLTSGCKCDDENCEICKRKDANEYLYEQWSSLGKMKQTFEFEDIYKLLKHNYEPRIPPNLLLPIIFHTVLQAVVTEKWDDKTIYVVHRIQKSIACVSRTLNNTIFIYHCFMLYYYYFFQQIDDVLDLEDEGERTDDLRIYNVISCITFSIIVNNSYVIDQEHLKNMPNGYTELIFKHLWDSLSLWFSLVHNISFPQLKSMSITEVDEILVNFNKNYSMPPDTFIVDTSPSDNSAKCRLIMLDIFLNSLSAIRQSVSQSFTERLGGEIQRVKYFEECFPLYLESFNLCKGGTVKSDDDVVQL